MLGDRESLLPAAFAFVPVPHSPPWPRFLSPLIEPDVRFSRIRLSDKIMRSPTESWPLAVSRRVSLHSLPESLVREAHIRPWTSPCACGTATGAAAGLRADRSPHKPDSLAPR